MARYKGPMANAAGSAIAVLDVELVKNANWTVHDAAAGVNEKVYKCAGAVTFYVWIGDNQTNYFNVRVWAAWDEVTHTGSGSSTTNIVFCKYYAGYAVIVNGNRFVFINLDAENCFGHYCGLINRLDAGANLVLVYGGASSTYYRTYNALGGAYLNGTYVRIRFLEDVSAAPDVIGHPQYNATAVASRWYFDLDRQLHVMETGMFVEEANPRYLVGFLDGVMQIGQTPTGCPYNSDDVLTVNGEDWAFYSDGGANPNSFLVRISD